VPQLIAQNYLQLQQDLQAILGTSKWLQARQQLAKAILEDKQVLQDLQSQVKSEQQQDMQDKGGGDPAPSSADANGGAAVGSTQQLLLDVHSSAAASGSGEGGAAPAAAGGGDLQQAVVRLVAAPAAGSSPGAVETTLQLDLQKLLEQIRSGELQGEPDGQGGRTITIGQQQRPAGPAAAAQAAPAGQQVALDVLQRPLQQNATNASTAASPPSETSSRSLVLRLSPSSSPTAAAGAAPAAASTITLTVPNSLKGQQLLSGLQQALAAALAQLGLRASDEGQLKAAAASIAQQLQEEAGSVDLLQRAVIDAVMLAADSAGNGSSSPPTAGASQPAVEALEGPAGSGQEGSEHGGAGSTRNSAGVLLLDAIPGRVVAAVIAVTFAVMLA
jgi:hypothetical protein